jgi:RNA polymerase sigma-70 factor (ECF subfamily)
MHPAGEPREEDVMISPEVYSKISAEETLQLVKELPVNTGLVFNLFVIEGYSHEEIGELLGIAAGTSKWHLNEARRLLKQKLELLYQTKKYSYVS